MTSSTKQALIHYIEFLKESGFLYLEAAGAGQTGPAGFPPPPAPAKRGQGASETMTPRARKMETGEIQPDLFAGRPQAEAKPQSRSPRAGTIARPETIPAQAQPVLHYRTGVCLPREERIARLKDGALRAEACRACPLGKQRNKLVYADGDPEAKIGFVGEAPGGEEDATGLPFVGRAGKLLNKMIEAIGFQREEVYICNTLKCHPPENRDPFPAEKAACEHFLIEQFEIVRPRILVALGAHAAQYLCRSEDSIGRLRGKWHDYYGILLLATYHPAFLLRSESFKPKSWEDFKMIHAKYVELNPDDARPLWRKKS